MKVYASDGVGLRLVGTAEVPEGSGPVFVAHLFGAASVIAEHYHIEAVQPADGGEAEDAVVLRPRQPPDFLPRWKPANAP
jgi:hypothetical protein